MSDHRAVPPNIQLLQIMDSEAIPRLIQAVAYYDIASLIGDGEQSTVELARTTGTHEDSLFRVLRTLAAEGIFAEVQVENRIFKNTTLSHYLREDVQGSMRAMACMRQTKRYRNTWEQIEAWMCDGKPVGPGLYGSDLYSYLQKHSDEADLFDRAMTSFSSVVDRAIAQAFDFSVGGLIADIGGGRGSLLHAILERYPSAQGILFDRPDVIDRIKAEKKPFLSIGGDFFHSVPQADLYLLKEIFHNWSDEECVAILEQCKFAMSSDTARVLVCEQKIDPENGKGFTAKWLDILMGLEQNGKERTEEEYQAIFSQAGFVLVRRVDTRSPHCIFEARKR